ncbi:beta-ketoacyl synthase N-terminal-like domain-containing protein [Neolewinella agarilytica]|uniref:Beta-ketoacyl synthase, N-terminal domain n=1 Tax=Neolewinella agarilytica TaxID=478744 RepID=A0A1H9ALC3_9BACT|nr:beta-ketoacyl synthase N-terminal-like domain-containing protein [Neolewinella agarilytica]SEP77183.1 Beta-ketoacyl synthase, N-terminal domain [Neolewinella agarilytica]
MQPVYINGAARIGAKPITDISVASIQVEEPDYTQYIDKRKLRRMDRLSRFALHTTYAALEEAKIETIDGVVMGIGQTVSQTTDDMLRKMIEYQEGLTNPTRFMNSLLGTAAGQIALRLNCNGYSNTHTQRGFSIESALMDAALQLQTKSSQNIIVGGLDIVGHDLYAEMSAKYGQLTSAPSDKVNRTIGEGGATFLVSGQPSAQTQACLRSIFTVFLTDTARREWSAQELQRTLFGETIPTVDLIISGRPFGNEAQRSYDNILEAFSQDVPVINYKLQTGEFPTAAAHGLYLAVKALSGTEVKSRTTTPERILVINNYGERYLSAFLVTQQ